MPANSIFSSHDLAGLRRVFEDVTDLFIALELDVPASSIAEAVMNSATYCSDKEEVYSKALARLTADARLEA